MSESRLQLLTHKLSWERRNRGAGQYNRHRYYSPELGRYISADPIGQVGLLAAYRVSQLPAEEFESGVYDVDAGVGQSGADLGLHLFAYVHNDPLNRVDPKGLADIIDFPSGRARKPGTGIPRGPATVHDLSKAKPYSRVMDPKLILQRTARAGGIAAAGAAAGYATYCAGSRAFCYLGQSSLSPASCMQTFDPSGVCCAIPGGGPECDPDSPAAQAGTCGGNQQ